MPNITLFLRNFFNIFDKLAKKNLDIFFDKSVDESLTIFFINGAKFIIVARPFLNFKTVMSSHLVKLSKSPSSMFVFMRKCIRDIKSKAIFVK